MFDINVCICIYYDTKIRFDSTMSKTEAISSKAEIHSIVIEIV